MPDLKKHLESQGPFSGLWVRTSRALEAGGYTSRAEVHQAVLTGKLQPFISTRDIGKKAYAEILTWLDEKAAVSA